MTAVTLTLSDFLLARFDEDEEGAREHDTWAFADIDLTGWLDPHRVLAECEAKRQIVAEHSPSDLGREFCRVCSPIGERFAPYPCDTLRYLALPYADHPDFRPEWRPM